MNYHTDLFTGSFGYSVPFDLAPARHGSAPSIALTYTSSGQNGWCGVGWDLDLGFIQRDTKKGVPVKWASGAAQSEYEDGKGFVFSVKGQSAALVPVATNEFRAEIEGGFFKFLLQTNDNKWVVTDKSGNQFTFGHTTNSRMSNAKSGWSPTLFKGTFRWGLEQVQTVLGDTTQITYTNFSGTLYPLLVAYNGHTNGLSNTHTVDFLLADRNDTRISLISGYRVDLTKRLSAVVHKVSGQLVWSNSLSYTASASTTNSLLGSITRYGTNGTESLPPLTFGYSQIDFRFLSPVNWTNLFLPAGGSASTYFGLFSESTDVGDFDGDGLPDRVIQPVSAPFTNWLFQRNTGFGFGPALTVGPLGIQTYSSSTTSNNQYWAQVRSTHGRLLDINGDGKPDRVMDPFESYFNGGNSNAMVTNYSRLVVELNDSSNLLASVYWTNVADQIFGSDPNGQMGQYRAVENPGMVRMIDMNGDGLPDRVMRKRYQPYTYYVVQFNTGGGFTGTNVFGPYQSQNYTNHTGWAALESDRVRLLDINGDNLPDRVMLKTASGSDGVASAQHQTNYVVELNNGYGFEAAITWSGVEPAWNWVCGGGTTPGYAELGDSSGIVLRDMNGDGLPDRLFRYQCSSYYGYWFLQLNTGTGFGPWLYWAGATPVNSQGQPTSDDFTGIQSTSAALFDINGDGLPDRVSAPYSPTSASNYFVVELNKGPFPDLLTTVSNGIGGALMVSYKPSTQYDNREADYTGSPTNDRVRRLLPHPIYTVSSVVTADGIHTSTTNSYSYLGGMWNSARREFHGFSRVTATDSLGGSAVHWFHQSGGRDNSALGEYQDTASSLAKKGMPFRIETRGTNGLLYSLVVNKVEEATLSGSRGFAFVSQTMDADYPAGSTNAYRATAEQMVYDTSIGNLTNRIQFGEVTNLNFTTHGFTDVQGDEVYQFTTFATLANPAILDKPQRVAIAADTNQATILRESLFDYDGQTGNVLQQRGLICPNTYRTNRFGYDSYGNQTTATNPVGIVSVTAFDATYQTFPFQQRIDSFTNLFTTDVRSGQMVSSTDPKGLTISNRYDAFLRPIESYVSSTAGGAANVWQERHDYGLGGIVSGASKNFHRVRANDAVDATNGHETWTYVDGIGRQIQQRVEAETNGYRTTDVRYDLRGAAFFATDAYLSSGTNYVVPTGTKLGTRTEYDAIARSVRVTPAQNGAFSGGLVTVSAGSTDSGSLTGPSLIAYEDGSDPWALVLTDAENEVRK